MTGEAVTAVNGEQFAARPEAGRGAAGQAVRFCVVGLSNFAVSFAVYYLFYHHVAVSVFLKAQDAGPAAWLGNALVVLGIRSVDAAFANLCGYTAGMINSFVWNRLWTFRHRERAAAPFGKFVLVNVLCLLASSTGVFVMVDCWRWPYAVIWFGVNGLITVASFFIYRHWVFATRKREDGNGR